MPAIQHLLQRWGFVKLRRYGLELTSDGRILSTRNAVLDDGTGGPVVGWQDGDVSIWKLSRWAAGPAVGSQVATPVVPAAATRAKGEVAAAAAPTRPSARVIPAAVAGEPVVEEDDWEWTIALARARVAVEEAEAARPPAVASRPEPRPEPTPAVPAHPEPAASRPPERPTLRSSATAELAASGDWRKSDSMDAIDTAIEGSAYEDFRISRPAAETPRGLPLPRVVAAAAGSPNTVIPVPALPTVDATRQSRLEPVVRTPSASALANRFAKGTGPVDPPTPPRSAAMVVEDTIPNLSVGDRTRPGVAPASRRMASPAPSAELGEPVAPPAGDRTRPGIALPPAARAVELPSIKRRTAR